MVRHCLDHHGRTAKVVLERLRRRVALEVDVADDRVHVDPRTLLGDDREALVAAFRSAAARSDG